MPKTIISSCQVQVQTSSPGLREARPERNIRLEFHECSQAQSLLAFAVSVSGTEDCFPALLGVSIRSSRVGVVDLMPHETLRSETLVCLVEHPNELGDVSPETTLRYTGEITFALWRDKTYRSELARIPWREWTYANLGSPNPGHRVDPCTAAYLESDFEMMRQRYVGKPHWIAHRIERRRELLTRPTKQP